MTTELRQLPPAAVVEAVAIARRIAAAAQDNPGPPTAAAVVAEGEWPPCECYSCDRQCGGTAHPGWCGPTAPDPEGRPICAVCQQLAQVYDDHRTGAAASICQDRVRVSIKFGESAWLAPESARALGVLLCELADRLAEDLAPALPVVDVAAVKACHNYRHPDGVYCQADHGEAGQ